MHTVYVLQDKNGKMYKGMTDNLERRIKEHLAGKTQSTKGMVLPEVVYTETFQTRLEARAREKYLKSAAGRRFLKEKLRAHSSAG